MNKTKNKYIIIGVMLSLLVVGLFITGIVQTFVYNNLALQNQIATEKLNETEKSIKNIQKEIDYKTTDEAKEEYFHSKEQTKDGEVIYK